MPVKSCQDRPQKVNGNKNVNLHDDSRRWTQVSELGVRGDKAVTQQTTTES